MNKSNSFLYRVEEIPDPTDPKLVSRAHGNILTGIRRSVEHLLNTINSFLPDCMRLDLLYVFHPENRPDRMQSRLRLYVRGTAINKKWSRVLRLLLENGPLSHFYTLETTETVEWPHANLNVVCDVVRRETIISPLFGAEFNRKVPSVYYQVSPFEPEDTNDYLTLDAVLNQVNEAALIVLSVEPVDVAPERLALTQYCSRLAEINRPWEDERFKTGEIDFLGDGNRGRTSGQLDLPQRKDPLADTVLRAVEEVRESLHESHLRFIIRVMTPSEETSRLLGSVLGEAAFRNSSFGLVAYTKADQGLDWEGTAKTGKGLPVVPTPGSDLSSQESGLYGGISHLAHVATPKELAGVFRLPVGWFESPWCIRQNTDPPILDASSMIVLGTDAVHQPGRKDDRKGGVQRGIIPRVLRRHVFIAGNTGTGKSTSLFTLCMKFHELGVPFLFFAPIAGEQSALKLFKEHPDAATRQFSKDLQIYTPGKDSVSPVRFNPLLRNANVSVDEQVESVLACIKGTVPVFAAFEGVLRDALYEVYEKTLADCPPTLADLVRTGYRVLEEKGYTGEVYSNIRAAIEVRMGGLLRGAIGRVFGLGLTIPSLKTLTSRPVILQLDALPEDEAAKLILFYLERLLDGLRQEPYDGKSLRLVIVIDEAHRIVGKKVEAQESEQTTDPSAHASKRVCHLLAELRKRGVGIIIADQTPSAVSSSVIKLTGTKLAFSIPDREDKEVLASAMLLDDTQVEELSRLGLGEAFFITEGYYRPRRIHTTNLHEHMDLSKTLTDSELRSVLEEDSWFQECQVDRISAEFSQAEEEIMALLEEAMELHLRIQKESKEITTQAKGLSEEIAQRSSEIVQRLTRHVKRLESGTLQELRDIASRTHITPMKSVCHDLLEHYQKVLLPGVNQVLATLGTPPALTLGKT